MLDGERLGAVEIIVEERDRRGGECLEHVLGDREVSDHVGSVLIARNGATHVRNRKLNTTRDDGRGIEKFDGSYDQGTSFAAPRVAGYAAIIRQKFPNLNAAKTSNIILDTATWNTRWGEKNTSTQAIYGQGEASLSRALAPVGRLR